MKLDIKERLTLLARGDNLDLADIVCADAVARIEQLEAALRLARPYIKMYTSGPNGTMATVLAKIDAALAPEQDK